MMSQQSPEYPPFEKTVLPPGIRVLTSRNPHARSVSMVVYVGAGSRYEDDEHAGVSHFLEHMLFKGTHSRPSPLDISQPIEGVGGSLNGGTDRELTSYWCRVARPHFRMALDVLMDMVRSPLMDPAEMEKEREVVLEELRMTNDYPHYRVDMLLDEMQWPNQPLGRDVGGSLESVRGLTHEMLVDYLSRQYTPSNIVVSVAGDVSHQEVVEAVAPFLDGWPSGAPLDWYPAVETQTESQTRVEYRKTEQANLCVGLKGLANGHPDRYALDMLSTILGEGMGSRLFVELREKQGLAYDVHSGVTHLRDCGTLVIYSGVEPRKTRRALDGILKEVRDLKREVPEEELSRAKELAKGRLLLQMEDTRAVARWMGAQELLRQKVVSVDEVVERVDAVTPQDLHRVANDLLVTEKLSLAIVGSHRSERPFAALLSL